MRFNKRRWYAKAALLTQKLGLERLSWHCAAEAGFFDKSMPSSEEPFHLMRPIYHQCYLHGYYGNLPSRWLRKLLAKSTFHRAWLAGHMGIFGQEGAQFGVMDRDNYQFRKPLGSPRKRI
jgi:hypothetical protein